MARLERMGMMDEYGKKVKLDEKAIINAIRTAIDEEGMAQVIAECEKQPSKGEDTCKKCRFRRKRPGSEIHGCLFHVYPMEWEG